MHILIANDDGIQAPGIRALTEAMRAIADQVTVIAPALNQSASGHKKTLNDPLRIVPVDDFMEGIHAYAVTGSPSDCVAVAMLGFVENPIDLVVSGINMGPNLAQDVTYSGTVAVALESVIFGVPAVAFSLDNRGRDADYTPSIAVAQEIVQAAVAHTLPPLTILNVNIPDGQPQGIKITRQGVREYRDKLVKRMDPHGRPYYWLGGERPTGDVNLVGTDLWAVHSGYVSVTPLHLDLTAHPVLDDLTTWGMNL